MYAAASGKRWSVFVVQRKFIEVCDKTRRKAQFLFPVSASTRFVAPSLLQVVYMHAWSLIEELQSAICHFCCFQSLRRIHMYIVINDPIMKDYINRCISTVEIPSVCEKECF